MASTYRGVVCIHTITLPNGLTLVARPGSVACAVVVPHTIPIAMADGGIVRGESVTRGHVAIRVVGPPSSTTATLCTIPVGVAETKGICCTPAMSVTHVVVVIGREPIAGVEILVVAKGAVPARQTRTLVDGVFHVAVAVVVADCVGAVGVANVPTGASTPPQATHTGIWGCARPVAAAG